jgi:hypothetical protein
MSSYQQNVVRQAKIKEQEEGKSLTVEIVPDKVK